MNVLLTGASGYIGSQLRVQLELAGHNVACLTRNPKRRNDFAIPVDQDSLQALCSELRPKCIVHLATLYTPSHTSSDLLPMADANIIFGLKLIDAVVNSGATQYINIGTTWQEIGRNSGPNNLYAAMKAGYEKILDFYAAEYTKIEFHSLRLADVYGEKDPRKKIINILLDHIGQDEPLDVTSGDQELNLVYVMDVCKAIFQVIEGVQKQKITTPGVVSRFDVRQANPIKLRELFCFFQKNSGNQLKLNIGGRGYRSNEILKQEYKTEILPGWVPQQNLFEYLLTNIEQRVQPITGVSSSPKQKKTLSDK